MKTTRYFDRRRQSPERAWYLRDDWCERVLAAPMHRETQADGRIRFWGMIPELNDRVLRVITLEDGETVHDAFLDRNFRRRWARGERP